MAKPKLTLTPSATFKVKVGIPVPGNDAAEVEFTFKHRDCDEYEALRERLKSIDETDLMMEIVTGWDLDDAFDRDNMQKLLKQYMGSGMAIFQKYTIENTGAKLGN